jgi:hypothetical protein
MVVAMIVQPVRGNRAARDRADGALDVAVQFEHVTGPGLLVKAVHVLGDESELRLHALQSCKRKMPRIGRAAADQFAPPLVPVPDARRVLGEAFW